MNRFSMLLVAFIGIVAIQASHANDITHHISRLSNDSYEQRELAVVNLVKIGEAAIPALMNVAKNGDTEAKWRAFRSIKLIVKDNEKLQEKTKSTASHAGIDWMARRLVSPVGIPNTKTVVRGSLFGSPIYKMMGDDPASMEVKKAIIFSELEAIIKEMRPFE